MLREERPEHARRKRAHLGVVESLYHCLPSLYTCVREGAHLGRVGVAPLAPVERLVKPHDRAGLAKIDEGVADVRLRAEVSREVEEVCRERARRDADGPQLVSTRCCARPGGARATAGRAPYSFWKSTLISSRTRSGVYLLGMLRIMMVVRSSAPTFTRSQSMSRPAAASNGAPPPPRGLPCSSAGIAGGDAAKPPYSAAAA